MKITKIIIENFKSIEKIEFDIKKYGNSYTTMFLGINESGKSNILEAMSFFNNLEKEVDYNIIHNQKDEKNGYVDLWFFLNFENKNTYLTEIKKKVENGNILDFEISNIKKNIYLGSGTKKFEESFEFDIKKLTKNLFIKKVTKNETVNGQVEVINSFEISKKNDEEKTYEDLTDEFFREHFEDLIISIIKKYEPQVSFWKPSDKYLISEVDLNIFKDNISSNIPLKNIFALAGITKSEEIKKEIDKISNSQLRRKLMGNLSKSTTEYVKKIWKHKINIDIEITDSDKCIVSIKDDGEKNEYNYHQMSVRSEGFKQFMSLILSLSIETKKLGKINKLILIDEPEAHLHPSGIRDLREELLEIGKSNYLFVSTHSPFLVDRKNKERNIIIKKNNDALTEKKEIKNEEDIRDDEVLDEAFGINVYKDLLNPYRILVEGSSDKIILQKAFNIKKYKYGITNGIGSNIVQLASKLNQDDIKVLVIVDDDKDGKEYKNKILKIKGVYNQKNVFTIRDVVGEIKNEGTIEDILGKDFIESKFKEFYKSEFKEDCNYNLLEDFPFLEQIKIFLKKQNKFKNQFLDDFKKKISDDFNPNKGTFDTKFPLLKSFVNEVQKKLK
jgi:predicted ATP-dependent endonuclease of OLD family